MILKLKDVTYLYDQRKTDGIKSLSFEVNKGDVLSIIGPSGSGKSTTLKLIANILTPQKGEVVCEKDNVHYVPQSTNTELDETVFDLLFNEINHMQDPEKQENQVRATLSTLQITNEIRTPLKQLSGGQKQRVIIAKALIHNPDVLLLDEPFGHLDEALRFNLISELFTVFKDKNISVIWVTHDTHEALAFSDETLIMNFGKKVQHANTKEVFEKPNGLFSAKFQGIKNVFATIAKEKENQLELKLFGKSLEINTPKSLKLNEHGEVLVILKNNALNIEEKGSFSGKVEEVFYYGDYSWLKVKMPTNKVWIKDSSNSITAQTKVRFNLNPDLLVIHNEV